MVCFFIEKNVFWGMCIMVGVVGILFFIFGLGHHHHDPTSVLCCFTATCQFFSVELFNTRFCFGGSFWVSCCFWVVWVLLWVCCLVWFGVALLC